MCSPFLDPASLSAIDQQFPNFLAPEVDFMMFPRCGVGENSWECPLDCKAIQPLNLKGNQSWIFIGRTDCEAEAAILWPPVAKS